MEQFDGFYYLFFRMSDQHSSLPEGMCIMKLTTASFKIRLNILWQKVIQDFEMVTDRGYQQLDEVSNLIRVSTRPNLLHLLDWQFN